MEETMSETMHIIDQMANAKTSKERLELSIKLAKANDVPDDRIMKSSDDLKAWLGGAK
jgi:hypothetical protein